MLKVGARGLGENIGIVVLQNQVTAISVASVLTMIQSLREGHLHFFRKSSPVAQSRFSDYAASG